eukprot:scaffold51654_cov39-Phaeocystis_antarctica.AAC.2
MAELLLPAELPTELPPWFLQDDEEAEAEAVEAVEEMVEAMEAVEVLEAVEAVEEAVAEVAEVGGRGPARGLTGVVGDSSAEAAGAVGMAAAAEGASLEVITSIIGSDRERGGLRRAATLLRTALAVQPASPLVSNEEASKSG